jgi:hypothetical protein
MTARLQGWRLALVAWLLELPLVGGLLGRRAASRLVRGLGGRS